MTGDILLLALGVVALLFALAAALGATGDEGDARAWLHQGGDDDD